MKTGKAMPRTDATVRIRLGQKAVKGSVFSNQASRAAVMLSFILIEDVARIGRRNNNLLKMECPVVLGNRTTAEETSIDRSYPDAVLRINQHAQNAIIEQTGFAPVGSDHLPSAAKTRNASGKGCHPYFAVMVDGNRRRHLGAQPIAFMPCPPGAGLGIHRIQAMMGTNPQHTAGIPDHAPYAVVGKSVEPVPAFPLL